MNNSQEIKIIVLLKRAFEMKASDLHLMGGSLPIVRKNGYLLALSETSISDEDMLQMVDDLLGRKPKLAKKLEEEGQVDFACEKTHLGRLRVNIYRQKGKYALAIRLIDEQIPTMKQLGLPCAIFERLAENRRGLILITGPTGSGKSSTLASLLDYMNETRSEHILTLEDPIEYLHHQKKCLISQREIGLDTPNYAEGLRAALREDPDVILVGEMRDLDTIATTITAAETGHLVLSTLHTIGAAQTIDRIVDVFPASQQQYIRMQLANVLKAVISQQLLPISGDKGRCAALEIMINNYGISNMIREGRTHQIDSQIQTGSSLGMVAMDESIMRHYQEGIISKQTVYQYSQNKDEMMRRMSR